jgi:hypothetical protein
MPAIGTGTRSTSNSRIEARAAATDTCIRAPDVGGTTIRTLRSCQTILSRAIATSPKGRARHRQRTTGLRLRGQRRGRLRAGRARDRRCSTIADSPRGTVQACAEAPARPDARAGNGAAWLCHRPDRRPTSRSLQGVVVRPAFADHPALSLLVDLDDLRSAAGGGDNPSSRRAA